MKVLMIVSHPRLETGSIANKIIAAEAGKLDNVETRDLHGLYPQFEIDVQAEQDALEAADLIVLQFPLFWFSIPAMLKHWLDNVFTEDFAFGPEAHKLKGKEILLSVTVGGPEGAYSKGGHFDATIDDLLQPMHLMAGFTGMTVRDSIVSFGMMASSEKAGEPSASEKQAPVHAERLVALLKA